MANIILVNSTVWGKQLHGGVEKLCSKQERTILVVCSFFWQVFEASFTYLPLLSLLIVTEWRLWTCTSVLVTMMRAEWKLCNTSHFEYTEVTNVGGCPKVKTNITKFTVLCVTHQMKEKRSSWLKCVIKCYRYRISIGLLCLYIYWKKWSVFLPNFLTKNCLCLCLLVGHATSPPPSDQLSERSQVLRVSFDGNRSRTSRRL